MTLRVFSVAAAMLISAVSICATSPANAIVYNLATDFSNTAHPNGVWSYRYNNANVPHVAAPTANGNPLIPAISAQGYFSTGPDLNANTPDVLKAVVNGSAAGLTNNDFLAGDVIIHSPNDGLPLLIQWTAPALGIASFTATRWYAHSSVTRSNDTSVLFNGSTVLGPTTITNGDDRNAPKVSSFGGLLTTGETLAISFTKSAGQQFGSLAGIQIIVDFTPVAPQVPVPGALPLFVSGLGAFGYLALRKRRRKHAAA